MTHSINWEAPENYVRYQLGDRRAGHWEFFDTLWTEADLPTRMLIPGTEAEPIYAWITVEEDCFVVYLPPEDPEWGASRERLDPGYAPTQADALTTFDAWARQFISSPTRRTREWRKTA